MAVAAPKASGGLARHPMLALVAVDKRVCGGAAVLEGIAYEVIGISPKDHAGVHRLSLSNLTSAADTSFSALHGRV